MERGSEGRWGVGGANILTKLPTQNAEFKNHRTIPHMPLDDSDKNTHTRAREICGSNTFLSEYCTK